MPPALGTNQYVTAAARVKALRDALGLSQEALADRAFADRPEEQRRVYLSKIETGANKASSYGVRAALAQGFGLSVDDMVAYLTGQLDVAEAVRRVRSSDQASRVHVEYELGHGLDAVSIGRRTDWQAARDECERLYGRRLAGYPGILDGPTGVAGMASAGIYMLTPEIVLGLAEALIQAREVEERARAERETAAEAKRNTPKRK